MTDIITYFTFEDKYIEVITSSKEQFEAIGNIINHDITIDSTPDDISALLSNAGLSYTIIGGRPPSR